MEFKNTYIEFNSLEYKFNVNFKINEVNYIDSHGDTFTFTTSDDNISIAHDSSTPFVTFTVENNILDMLSQELDVEVNKEMFMKMIEMSKKLDDGNEQT